LPHHDCHGAVSPHPGGVNNNNRLTNQHVPVQIFTATGGREMVEKEGEPDHPGGVVFQVRDLTKIYQMGEVEVHALRGVNLELFSGELVVFLGPSGSGKSTLLNILGGLDTATGGNVAYRGKKLTNAGERELTAYRRFHVGFVFQFYNLIPSLTARENVAVVTEIAQNPMTPEDALQLVGLTERLDHFPAQLSGGEQQRVAIARAISKSASTIFPPSSPAANSSAWRSPAPFQKIRKCFSATNPRGLLIPKRGSWSSKPWIKSTASWGPRRRSSPTTRTSPEWPTASFT